MWSIARHDLKLSDDDFYGLTPRQLDALIDRRERSTEEREFMQAQAIAWNVNTSMGAPKEAVQPKDFMPSEWRRKARVTMHLSSKPRTKRQIADQIHRVMSVFMPK